VVAILTRVQHTAVLILLLGALASSTLIVSVSAYTSIDVGTAHGMISDGAYPNLVILDVRTKGEYDSGHIYNATLIPVADLPTRIGELASHKNDPILVYCGSGGRSATASGILDSNGFTQVNNMLGGITAWKSAGYPTWIATVHNINTTYNYDTIQSAIDSTLTLDGNTILVDNGTYQEHVIADKTLSIIGENSKNTVIDGNGTGKAISVIANNVTVESFTIRNSSESGVCLIGGNYARIQKNNITNNYCGINVSSSYNMIFSNNIAGNQYCGVLMTSGSSTIFENNLTSNNYGICANSSQSSNGKIYHNNLNNTYPPVTNKAAEVLWDDGYPSGGNYWSDYSGTDVFSGASQTEIGSDGVGDTTYTIDANNMDHYPLIRPFLWGPRNLTIISGDGGTTSPAPGSYAYNTTTYVEVTATAYSDYTFDHWELDANNATQTSQISIRTDSDHTLKTVFTRTKYALTVTSTAGGNTNPTPGTYVFEAHTEASVSSISDPGYYLDGWELDNVYVGILSPISVIMNQNHTLHAVFRQLDGGHDIATKWIASKSVIGQGLNLSIQVTALNVGSYTENFSVTAYLDSTSTTSQEVTLDAGAYTTLTFTLNTSSVFIGNHTIWAHASPVPDETNLANNNLTDGWVIVSILGDITGPSGWPDRQVDMRDISYVARRFAISTLDPLWDPNADINGDGRIDMKDVAATARHFMEHYP
jgi:rhodanese-related sulfurtransferase